MEDRQTVVVILAGGKGKRMRDHSRQKVCYPIAGVPAIVRTVSTFKSAGLRRFLIVVGQMAEQVMSTIAAEHPEASFVYQDRQRGTGHAAGCAARALKAGGHEGGIVVTMGDKVLQPEVVTELLASHRRSRADITLTALPKSTESSAGRIVRDSQGRPIGIVEVADIRRAAETGNPVPLAGQGFSAEQVEQNSHSVNASLYLFGALPLYDAIDALRSDNAQGELYLTDTLAYAVARGLRVNVMDVTDPEDLMTYNTPEELKAIEDVLARRRN